MLIYRTCLNRTYLNYFTINHVVMRHILLIWLASLWCLVAVGRSQGEERQVLFSTQSGNIEIPPYRIPGICCGKGGRLVAAAARLVCGTDPGHGRVDCVVRLSEDNGMTWSPEIVVAEGTGRSSATHNYFDCAFGDPAVVMDRGSNEVLIMAVAGCTVYGNARTTRRNPNLIATIHSNDGGRTWQNPVDVTQQVYGLFDDALPLEAAFVAGGRICQSRRVKVGRYYRLYAALTARPGGNRVLFSDDFGRTWQVLGDAASLPVPEGDEAKCEELPNGSVVVSSRTSGGRFFNLFTYTDARDGRGSWGGVVKATFQGLDVQPSLNPTNGELLVVPALRRADGRRVHLALQSMPTGQGRENVGIFYKELSGTDDYRDAGSLAASWDGFHPVSSTSSAYSSLCLQGDGRIGFFYEETLTRWGRKPNPVSTCFPEGQGQHNYDGFENIYLSLSLETITGGRYAVRR